ncbi:LpxI family protein [Natronospora cellulosivora (SeqCode)]
MSHIGLIAGKGNLPIVWAKAAQEKGVKVIAYQLIEAADQSLDAYVDQVKKVSVGQLDKLIKTLLKDQVEQVVMIGKVEKSLLYQGLQIDDRFKMLIARLDKHSSDAITIAIMNEFEKEGIELLEQSIYLNDLLATEGILTSGGELASELLQDLKYALKIACDLARLEIGQTVIVKGRDVIAVEGIEGTDKTIQRAAKYVGSGIVMAKASEPQQDSRFDIPTVGFLTLENLIDANAKALVLEADSTFIIDKKNFIKKAEEHNIIVCALRSEDL